MIADILPQKVMMNLLLDSKAQSKISPDSVSSSGLQKLPCNAGPLTNDQKNKRTNQEDLPVASVSGLQNSSKLNQQIKFVEIRPLPKIILPILETNKKKQKASILTLTPSKENLEEKERENSKNEDKKRECEERVKKNLFNKTKKKKKLLNRFHKNLMKKYYVQAAKNDTLLLQLKFGSSAVSAKVGCTKLHEL
ncbi:hypothetical protein MML48_9g00003626 [Holotrichia oblita]|uniref:Uncharacterized protein n=1 Tax=Holotrichia oblita TaxID=644536 RepID=A0ACB9SJC2_HOLOL|nr:hypothetical protein MML48_9g00003626 [Holotrichia oblita]